MRYLRLKDLGRWYSGGTPPKDAQEYWEGDLPWLSAKDIDSTRLREPTVFITRDAAQRHSRLAPAGALIMIVRGMALAHGLPVVRTEQEVAFNQDLRALVCAPGIEPRFVYYSLLGHRWTLDRHIDRAAHGTARVIDSVYSERVPVPTNERQRQVADFLDQECARIETLREELEVFRVDARTGFWHQAYNRIVGGDARLVRLKHAIRGWLNGTWGDEPGRGEQDVQCVRVADFDRRRLRVSEAPTTRSVDLQQLRRLRLQDGDLLMEKSGGGSASPVGFVAMYRGTADNAVCSNFIARLRPADGFDAGYLVHVFGSLYGLRRNAPFVKQVTGIQNLDAEAYLGLKMPFPAEAIQREIGLEQADSLEALLSLEDEIHGAERRLLAYRDALISEAVTGARDVIGISEARLAEGMAAARAGGSSEVGVP